MWADASNFSPVRLSDQVTKLFTGKVEDHMRDER